MKLTKNEKRRELISMTKTETYKKGQELDIRKSMKPFANESKNYSGMNVHKVINIGGQQVLVYSGSHDGEIGIMEFVFAHTGMNVERFDLEENNSFTDYITIQIDNPVVAEHKSYFGQKVKAEVDFRTVNACKTVSDLVDYLMSLDFMDYGYAKRCWSGFDYDFTTSIK